MERRNVMFEENDRDFEDNAREEMVHRYEDLLRKKKPLYFDIDDFESIIDFYLDRNKINSALEATRIAAGLFPTSPEIMLRKAQLLIDKGKPMEAIIEIKNALLHDVSNFELYLLLGIASLQLGNLKDAVKSFDDCVNRIDEDIKKDDILLSIGFHLGHANKYNLALKYLFRCVELNSENVDALAEISFCYDGLAQYDKSIVYYQKCLDIDPFAEHLWYNLGLVYSKTNQISKSLEAFDYALAIDPTYLSAYMAKANIFLNQEKFGEAVKVYEGYLDYDSGYVDIYYYIGECYEKMNKLDQALKYYELAVAKNEKHFEAWLGMGVIQMYLENYSKSLIHLKTAISLEPNNPEAQYSIAELFLKTKKYKEGLRHVQLAINASPTEVDYFLLQSEIYFALKQQAESISVLETGLLTAEEKAPIYYRLAGLLINDKTQTAAAEYLNMAIQEDKSLIADFLKIFPEAKSFAAFKGLLNLPDQKNKK